MKIFLLVVLIMVFVGCAEYRAEGNRNLLRKSDSIGRVVYDRETYYVVKVTDLKKARKGPPTYVGSIEDYHLFRVWLKILDAPDEISFFAVKREDCTVEDEKLPGDEDEHFRVSATTPTGWREIEFKNEKCFVKRR